MTSRAFLGIADAAGRVHLSEHEWLLGMCAALRAARPKCVGASGYIFRFAEGSVDLVEHVFDTDILSPAAGAALAREMSDVQLDALLGARATVTTATAAFGGRLPDTVRHEWASVGVRDALGLFATLDDGHGILLVTMESQRLDARVARQAALVVESIRTSLKVRRALGDRPLEEAVEGVFDATAHFHHATQGLEARLVAVKKAVLGRDGGRALPGPEDTDAITEDTWSQLCAGRYRLLDQLDRDGRRYVVLVAAHRPDPVRALTPLEAEIAELAGSAWGNKQIAFELGLSESAVENHVGRILSKLRLGCRLELVRLYTQLERCTARCVPSTVPDADSLRPLSASDPRVWH